MKNNGGLHISGDGIFVIYEVKDGVQSPRIEE